MAGIRELGREVSRLWQRPRCVGLHTEITSSLCVVRLLLWSELRSGGGGGGCKVEGKGVPGSCAAKTPEAFVYLEPDSLPPIPALFSPNRNPSRISSN